MFHNNYKTKYTVKYRWIDYMDKDDKIFDIEILTMFELFTFEEDNILKSVVIEPYKWKNIALVPLSKNNISSLKRGGAEIIKSSLLFDKRIDAKLQMAFVCSKYLIPVSDIYCSTDGEINEKQYKDLLKYFYDEFPEKFI